MTAPLHRPAGVLGAAYLFSGAAALWTSAACASLFAIPHYQRYYGDLRDSADAALLAGLLTGSLAGGALLLAGLALLLAQLDLRGRSGARAMTYVVAAAAVAMSVTILVLDLFAVISWHRWLMAGAALLTLGLVVGVGVLLALPSSRAYFRQAGQERAERAARARLARQHQAMPHPGAHPWPGGYPPVPPGGYPPAPPPPPPPPPRFDAH
ncbi:hypothetical protein AB0F81_07795 [Actinoplanes sp. NPDC024001]|uniref:hypothetical protein n=1 Tax=Actinoplanes sp. NPDC024001 TaxID=3154598 RepID=UPI0033E77C8E